MALWPVLAVMRASLTRLSRSDLKLRSSGSPVVLLPEPSLSALPVFGPGRYASPRPSEAPLGLRWHNPRVFANVIERKRSQTRERRISAVITLSLVFLREFCGTTQVFRSLS